MTDYSKWGVNEKRELFNKLPNINAKELQIICKQLTTITCSKLNRKEILNLLYEYSNNKLGTEIEIVPIDIHEMSSGGLNRECSRLKLTDYSRLNRGDLIAKINNHKSEGNVLDNKNIIEIDDDKDFVFEEINNKIDDKPKPVKSIASDPNKRFYNKNGEKSKIYCEFEGCEIQSSFNFASEIHPRFCKLHKLPDMDDIKACKCIEPGCNINPCFNFNGLKAAYCNTHKLKNMENVSDKMCIKGCGTRACFGKEGTKEALYCVKHKTIDCIDVKHKFCTHPNCKKQPNYGMSKEGELYCKEHKLKDMVDIKHKSCENCGCRPNFGYVKPAIYCGKCAINFVNSERENYINIMKNKTFDEIINTLENNIKNIIIQFNISDVSILLNKIAMLKFPKMSNVNAEQCKIDDCTVRPCYNYNGEKIRLYCNRHKLDGMINITDKLCEVKGCGVGVSYAAPGSKTKTHCATHGRELNYINNDKNHVKCYKLDINCNSDIIYGPTGGKPYSCDYHKELNMVDLDKENKCSIINCSEKFTGTLINNIKYCKLHIPSNIMDVMQNKCSICDIRQNSNYICDNCKKINTKTEYGIVREIKRNIKLKSIDNSSKMLNGCSKRRPDVYYELAKHCVVVEIDENQHKSYTELCECRRLNEITNGIGGKSVIFIRYNPDSTKNNGNEINFIKNDKLDLLIKTINTELNKNYDRICVKIIQLFYDDDYKPYQEYKEEDITDLVMV